MSNLILPEDYKQPAPTMAEITQTEITAELSQKIIGDLEYTNNKLVEFQMQYTNNVQLMAERLKELNVDAGYIMSYIKAIHLITSNISSAEGITVNERHGSLVGSNISTSVIFSELLATLPGRDERIEVIAIASNLITVLEFANIGQE